MAPRQMLLAGLLAAGLLIAAAVPAQAGPTILASARLPSADAVPLGHLPPSVRAEVRGVLEKPTLAAQGPPEVFLCKPEQYYWFLDHPDRAVTAWRRLGAKCVSIIDQGNGLFSWSDDAGSLVTWTTVYHDGDKRVWYAWGKVRAAPLLPLVPVRVVLVLHHRERPAANGGALIQHHCDLFVHTDSRTASLATKMLGGSAPRLAEQGLGQLQTFFSALAHYLERNPRSAAALLRDEP